MEIEDAIRTVIDHPFLRIIDVPTVDINWAVAGCHLHLRLTLYKAHTRARAPRSAPPSYHLSVYAQYWGVVELFKR